MRAASGMHLGALGRNLKQPGQLHQGQACGAPLPTGKMPPTSFDREEPRQGHGFAPSYGVEARNLGLSLENLNNTKDHFVTTLGQARQALESDCSQPASSKQFLTAWRETRIEEQKLLNNPQFQQLRQEVTSLQECVGHLALLLDSLDKAGTHNSRGRSTACEDKLVQTNGMGEDSRMDFPTDQLQKLDPQQKPQQEQVHIEQLRRADSDSEPELESIGQKEPQRELVQQLPTNNDNKKKQKKKKMKQKVPTSNNSLGYNSIRTMDDNLGEQSQDDRSFNQLCWILIDSGAEISVAPLGFADHIQLSPVEEMQLRSANGKVIEAYGQRTVQLHTQSFNFTVTFVIADVEQPLLGLGTLLQANLCLFFDVTLGHKLVTSEGETIQLSQKGQQIYLPAFLRELPETSFLVANLQSLVTQGEMDQLELSLGLGEHKEVHKQGGANQESFSLDNLEHLRQQTNKPAIGQQSALPKLSRTKVGYKLRNQQLKNMKRIQLDLLDPRRSLEIEASRDLSLRILVTLSLLKRWPLTTSRIAEPPEFTKAKLRELGFRESAVDTQIMLGDQLVVMIHETWLLIGGAELDQECFRNKLSDKIALQETTKLDENTPLTFMGRALEWNQADKSISLHLPEAFYNDLLGRYSLEDAKSSLTLHEFELDSLTLHELESERSAPRWNNSLDAEKAELFQKTVGDLQWASLLRPDLGLAVLEISKSFSNPTEKDEHKLRKVLGYLRRTQHYITKMLPPKRWRKAKNLELLAFTAASWTATKRTACGCSLFLLGVPLATSIQAQAKEVQAAELHTVGRACEIAAYTSNLLQELDIGKPISLRVLTGGFIASQLGLSKKNRHIELLSRMGQFQLSKIASSQNLAESLTHKLSASGLSRLLPKLKVHTRSASGVALPTGLRAEQAFFVGSSSFYIGMLTKHPAQLDLSELEQDAMAELQSTACRTELSGQELEKQNNLPKLEGIALHTEQIELEQSALQNDKIELGRSALHTEQIELHRSDQLCTLRR